jgi:hypothetical protein
VATSTLAKGASCVNPLGSGAGIGPKRGPGDFLLWERQADGVPVGFPFAAVHNLSGKLNVLLKRSDSYPFAKVPRTPREHTDTVDADILGVGQLSDARRVTLCAGGEVHNDSNRETFFHSSVKSMDDGHIARCLLPKFLRLDSQAPSPTAVQLGLITLRHT